MDYQGRFAVYLSHSWWPEDVELNLQVWNALGAASELLVDAPTEAGPNPPYYINRIEELLRRTDVFVSVLTYRPSKDPAAKLRCSPYMSFEIHLAERADRPRLVLYDRRTGFRPPETKRPGAVYQVFERGDGEPLPEQRQWRVVERAVTAWTEWVTTHYRPSSYELSTSGALLLDRRAEGELAAELGRGLSSANFTPWYCDDESLSAGEALRRVRDAGLVIADLGRPSERVRQLYAAAHVLGIPAVRLVRGDDPWPWILDSDAGGYREDVVRWGSVAEAVAAVRPRIDAMLWLSPALRDGKALEYLQSKRYSKFHVFVSHNLKDARRALVERVCAELRERQVPVFEYNEHNSAGIDWKSELDAALAKTTHFVALLAPDYEQSKYCTYEIDHALARGGGVAILPFMTDGRVIPHPKLEVHQAPLGGADAQAAALKVVHDVMVALDAANRRPRTA